MPRPPDDLDLAYTRDDHDRPDPSGPDPNDKVQLLVDRRAVMRTVLTAVAAIIAVAVAAGTIVVGIAFHRIGILEDDLNQRRAIRDKERRENQLVVCSVLNHVNEPGTSDLDRVRDLYQCPGPGGTAAPGNG